jgi:hypothetical protein
MLLDELRVLHVKLTDTTRIMNNEPEHLHNCAANILISVSFCWLVNYSSLQICINQSIFWHQIINSIHILKCQLSNPSAEILRWSSQENRSGCCSGYCNSAHAWPWYSKFKPPDNFISAAGRIKSIEKSNDLIGNRIQDFPAYNIMPQPTSLPRVNTSLGSTLKKGMYKI